MECKQCSGGSSLPLARCWNPDMQCWLFTHRNHPELERHSATIGGNSTSIIVENATLQADHAYPPHTVEGHLHVGDDWLSAYMFHLVIAFEAVSRANNNVSKNFWLILMCKNFELARSATTLVGSSTAAIPIAGSRSSTTSSESATLVGSGSRSSEHGSERKSFDSILETPSPTLSVASSSGWTSAGGSFWAPPGRMDMGYKSELDE